MWNKKRLDDLEKRIADIEDMRVCIPDKDKDAHYELYPRLRRIYPQFSISEALCIIIDYLHLIYDRRPAKAVITGILDEKESEDING